MIYNSRNYICLTDGEFEVKAVGRSTIVEIIFVLQTIQQWKQRESIYNSRNYICLTDNSTMEAKREYLQ